MKAQDFWEKFRGLFAQGSETLLDARRYWKNSGKFTKKFVNKYVPGIITEENDIFQFEYFRIDVISYSDRKDEAVRYGYDPEKLKPYLWDLKVAFEHENDKGLWLDEIIKLAHIRCPLRVTVGYFPEGKEREAALEFASAMLCKKQGEIVADSEEFLLILGVSGLEGKRVDASIYTPYLYQNGKFVKQTW